MSGHQSTCSTPSSVQSISKSNSLSKFVARFRGEIVHIKPIVYKSVTQTPLKQRLTPKAVRYLLEVYRLKHENITKFMAIYHNCIQIESTFVFVWEYCSRGTLFDVIARNDIKLDWNFKISLIGDIIRGMRYLHNSSVETHGYLNSKNCVIDSRWLLKVTNFGLTKFNEIQCSNGSDRIDGFDVNDMLWFAPELLRTESPFAHSSQKADVYSFAIILQEVLLRDKPFGSYKRLSRTEIIERIKHPPPLFRPRLTSDQYKQQTEEKIPKDLIKLIHSCWHEEPRERPSFDRIFSEFQRHFGEREKNIVDAMLVKIEMYSNNLEELVEQRTIELEEQRKRAETLLYRMLPKSVAENLKNGNPVQPERFDDVTIFFSDIIGFTTIASFSDPLQVITILNDLYMVFDDILKQFNVYKVETIGDAYMVVSGLPQRNEDHAEQIASMALEILHSCTTFKMRHLPGVPLRLRCGIHSGPVVGGVVGNTNPRYCLFGDTVNIASRLESTGRSYRIHISKATEEKLRPSGEYIIQYRGEITLKGRGKQPTYYLVGKVGFDKPLPQPVLNEEEGIDGNHGIHDEEIFTSLGLKKQLL